MARILGPGVWIDDGGVLTVDLDEVTAYLGIGLTKEEIRGLYLELADLLRQEYGPIPVEFCETTADGRQQSCTVLDLWEKGNGGELFSRN